jgi:predicted 2-oxoglutarate/Fe(II)-dependent dioxygenase YbiX
VEIESLEGIDIFTINGFLTPEECADFIAVSEAAGYADAPITTASGFVMRKDIRDNARVIHDDPELAARLFERARPFLPETWFTHWDLVGFNERFRYYRYDPGQKFDRHTDGCFQRDNGERSHLTFMIYLNEGCDGGATAFHNFHPSLLVRPETGKALVFNHRRLHEGMPVIRGRKYVLRTDVMYRRRTRNDG